jgi:histidinol phosphatase-like enzyme (inositol monophosphatase family)
MSSVKTQLSPLLREELIAAAHAAADAAGQAILPHFRHIDLDTRNKAKKGFDPVTEADRAAEAAMRAVLDAARPDDAILGEEFGRKPGTSGLEWVLDPIDGTRGFLSGTPTWGVLVSVRDAGGPLFGLIDQPYIGERFAGGLGVAEFRGPRGHGRLACRRNDRLEEAILFTTFPEVGTPEEEAAFRRLSARCRLTRYGMDCYAYALVALGLVDLVVEAGLHPYDVQAPIAVIEAAGGVVTDWQGGPAHEGGRIVAAANRDIHAAALEVLTPR